MQPELHDYRRSNSLSHRSARFFTHFSRRPSHSDQLSRAPPQLFRLLHLPAPGRATRAVEAVPLVEVVPVCLPIAVGATPLEDDTHAEKAVARPRVLEKVACLERRAVCPGEELRDVEDAGAVEDVPALGHARLAGLHVLQADATLLLLAALRRVADRLDRRVQEAARTLQLSNKQAAIMVKFIVD